MGRRLERYAHIPVRSEKAASDVEKIRKGARFILSLNENGECTLEEHDGFSANVFAVLAPTEVDGVFLKEALILEIGIGKGAPYTHTFRKDSSGKCLSVDRRKVREATKTEQRVIWKAFSQLMIRLTNERRNGWENRGKWFGHTGSGKVYAYTRGQRFSVSIDDQWICSFILEAEFAHRWKNYLHKSSHMIWRFLKRYRYTYYSRKQARAASGLMKTFDLLGGISFRHEFLRWRFVVSLGAKRATLIRNVADHFDCPLAESQYPIPRPEPKIPMHHIFVDRVDAENRGIIVFECAPDDVPKTGCGDLHQKGEADHPITDPNPDDDIPFTIEELAGCEGGKSNPSDLDICPF